MEEMYMKTNITQLMNLISEYERQLQDVGYDIRSHVINTSIIELDGKVNIVEDNKEVFNDQLEVIEELSNKISLLKGILYEKNNTFKLSDGRTIQTAIVENTVLRRLKSIYESIIVFRNSKKRVSEINFPYFECKEVNYDSNDIKSKINEIDSKLQQTDFEISKLNSLEFEISL